MSPESTVKKTIKELKDKNLTPEIIVAHQTVIERCEYKIKSGKKILFGLLVLQDNSLGPNNFRIYSRKQV